MAQAVWPLRETPRGFGETARRDAWWVQPALTFLGLSAFVVYSTWAAFQGDHYEFGPYLSPFYSPLLFGDGPHAWFGPKPGWWPGALPFSAALLILWAPGGFRFTCYYYRGAYYKAFWADPPACTVGEPRKSYLGERSFPLILQNIHRYFLYLALLFIVILTYDVWKAMWFTDPATGAAASASASARSSWPSTSCCSAATRSAATRCGTSSADVRDEVSKSPLCAASYKCASALNRRHMLFAWMSLFSVGFCRPLRAPLLDGRLARLQDPLSPAAVPPAFDQPRSPTWITKHTNTTSS